MAATMQEAWGFSTLTTATPDGSFEDVSSRFCKALGEAAKSRGIATHIPSDALDMSRDVMLDEAAQSIGMQWQIVGDTLRLWPVGVTIEWPADESDDDDDTPHVGHFSRLGGTWWCDTCNSPYCDRA